MLAPLLYSRPGGLCTGKPPVREGLDKPGSVGFRRCRDYNGVI